MERSHSCSSGDDNCGIDDSNNNNNHIHTHSPFNLRKAFELRQTRLQRQQQREQPTSPLLPQQQPQFHSGVNGNNNNNNNEQLHSPTTMQRIHHRRKRLQRQKSTELSDDADFAYAADLEEEDEDYDDNDIDNDNDVSPLRAYNIPTFASIKELQFSHAMPFSGQSSSLPNSFSTPTVAYNCAISRTLHQLKHEESFDSASTNATTTTTTSATNNTSHSSVSTTHSAVSPTTRRHNFAMLKRDNSTQSESSSRYSSVDSLLEARKPDPEAILINLGFGPVGSEDILSRIPKRFLKPSQVRGIDTDAFIRRLQLANNLADHSVLGYRGLTGNPDVPPSRIVAKIMQRFEVNERKKSMGSLEHTI